MSLIDALRRLMFCTSGAALVEATIVVPVAISLMAGGVEFGQLFTAYGTAEKSMRDAARYLARLPNQDTSAICGWGLANAQNMAMYGNVSGTGQPLISKWTDPTTVTLDVLAEDGTLLSNCSGGTVALTDPVILKLNADILYTGSIFAVIGLSNVWTIHVHHEERSIGE